MPYENTHALRLTDPDQYTEFKTFAPEGFPDGVYVILGIKEGKSEFQSLRGDATKISMADLKAFAKDQGFKVTKEEMATGAESDKDVVEKSLGSDIFSTWAEVQLCKGSEEEGRALIEGIISSDSVDQQGDRILQEGLDFSYFLQRGFLNDDHKQGAGNIVGQPLEIYETKTPNGSKATAMKGYLYTSKPKAKDIYETALALSQAKSDRKLGFSIEGQVLERDKINPHLIKKAKVLHVAITHQPVNPDASNLELIARSISEGGVDDGAKEMAHRIMGAFPEVQNPAVMAELHEMIKGYWEDKKKSSCGDEEMEMDKGEVGYQEPSTPDEEATLSPMVGGEADEDEKEIEIVISDPKKEIIDAVFSRLKDEFAKMADLQLSEILEPSTEKAVPMVSSSQLAWVIGNSFPNLSKMEAKKLATRLVMMARQ